MPKSQTRFASVARQIQAATGTKYTDALRLLAPCKEELALADALRTAGLTDAAAVLTSVTLTCTENGAWYDAYGQIEAAFHETDLGTVEKTRAVCRQKAEAVMRRAGFQYAGFEPAAEVHHAAFLALRRAGAVPDGRRLARTALGVFDGDPLMCSDIVRSEGRRPFTYQMANNLSGPDAPTAVAARKAARAMAAASQVGFGTDEQWHQAAELMVGAAWHGSVAAGLPPLHHMWGFQEFYAAIMDGPVDDFPDPIGQRQNR